MFCSSCGTWNRGAAKSCTQCSAPLPEVRAVAEAPDGLITALRQATTNRSRIIRRIGSGGMADAPLDCLCDIGAHAEHRVRTVAAPRAE